MATETMPKCIEDALAGVEERRAYVAGLSEIAAIVERTVEPFVETLPDLRVSVGWQAGTLNGVNVHAGGFGSAALRSIRDIFPLLRELRAEGFKPRGHEDYEEIGRRTYAYRRDGDPETAGVNVSAFLPVGANAEGAACRFEQVGVEEKPVYKLICDGEVVEAGSEA